MFGKPHSIHFHFRLLKLLQPYNNKSGQSSPSGPDRMYFLSFLSVHSHCFSLCFCKSDTWLLRLPLSMTADIRSHCLFSSVEVFFPLYTADSVVYAASHRAQNLRCCPDCSDPLPGSSSYRAFLYGSCHLHPLPLPLHCCSSIPSRHYLSLIHI